MLAVNLSDNPDQTIRELVQDKVFQLQKHHELKTQKVTLSLLTHILTHSKLSCRQMLNISFDWTVGVLEDSPPSFQAKLLKQLAPKLCKYIVSNQAYIDKFVSCLNYVGAKSLNTLSLRKNEFVSQEIVDLITTAKDLLHD